jgi:Uma2 family endonuclease
MWVEVVDGEVVEVEMTTGFIHGVIINNLYDLIKPFVVENKLGRVFGDGVTYVLHVDEQGVQHSRIADFSFIRANRIPKAFDRSRPFMGAPDLAVEGVSPTEKTPDLLKKIRDYLQYGAEQVWAIYPQSKELHQYLISENLPRVYKEADTFEAPTLFLGLQISIADLFRDED